MKSFPKIKRVQLNDNHTENVVIFGIVSTEPDYKLSQIINKKLSASLKNTSPVIITDEKGEQVFSKFSDLKVPSGLAYHLISNRSGKNFLKKKLKNIDFLFIVEEPESDFKKEKILGLLKGIELITAIFIIDNLTIKDKLQYLIQ